MLKVIHSNRLERLFDRLIQVLERPVDDPMRPETVVVQNPGMGRWVTLRLAERQGIAANIRYPLPAGFVWGLLRGHIPDLPEQSTFDRPVLTWRIMDLLPECRHEPGFEAINGYLAEEPNHLKWYQLSRRLADLSTSTWSTGPTGYRLGKRDRKSTGRIGCGVCWPRRASPITVRACFRDICRT